MRKPAKTITYTKKEQATVFLSLFLPCCVCSVTLCQTRFISSSWVCLRIAFMFTLLRNMHTISATQQMKFGTRYIFMQFKYRFRSRCSVANTGFVLIPLTTLIFPNKERTPTKRVCILIVYNAYSVLFAKKKIICMYNKLQLPSNRSDFSWWPFVIWLFPFFNLSLYH